MIKLLYLLSNFPSKNYGDQLINQCLIHQLSIHARVDVLYNKSDKKILSELNLLNNSNINLIEWNESFNIKKLLRDALLRKAKYDYICFLPGHYSFREKNRRVSNLKRSLLLLFLEFFGVKCIWICTSLDLLPFPERALVRFSYKYIHKYSVRDRLSKVTNRLNVDVWPDLSFLINPMKKMIKSESQKIIFSFRGDRGEKSENIVKNFCFKIITEISKTEGFNEVYCLVNVFSDLAFMQNLAKKLESEFVIKINLVYCDTLVETLNIYDEHSLVFTDRLHVALPAMINKSLAFPFIDLSLDRKIMGIYKDMGWEKFIISRPHHIQESFQIPDVVNLKDFKNDEMIKVLHKIEETKNELILKIAEIFS